MMVSGQLFVSNYAQRGDSQFYSQADQKMATRDFIQDNHEREREDNYDLIYRIFYLCWTLFETLQLK